MACKSSVEKRLETLSIPFWKAKDIEVALAVSEAVSYKIKKEVAIKYGVLKFNSDRVNAKDVLKHLGVSLDDLIRVLQIIKNERVGGND